MGRGGGQDVLKTQLAKTNAAADVAGGQATETFGTVNAADKDIIANPISDAEKTARTEGTLQPLAESFDASSQAAGNLAGKSRNFSGYQSSLDKQAQERAQKTAQANQSLTADIGNTAFARKMAALGQQQGMFGTATGAQSNLLGTGSRTAGDLAGIQSQPGFWDQLGSGFAGGIAKGVTGRIFGTKNA
jgi:hypothetical protein